MPWTEDNRNGVPFCIGEALQEIPCPTEPFHEFGMLLPAFEDGFNDLVRRNVPSVSPGVGVAGMPGEGHHPSPFGLGHGGSSHKVEGDSVKIVGVTQLDSS